MFAVTRKPMYGNGEVPADCLSQRMCTNYSMESTVYLFSQRVFCVQSKGYWG